MKYKKQRSVTEKQSNKIFNQKTTTASYGCGSWSLRKFLSIALFLLPFMTAAGQVKQENYNQIMNDSLSTMFHDGQNLEKYHDLWKYSFGGFKRVTSADKDTLVCYTYITGWGIPGYKNSVGTVNLKVEDQCRYKGFEKMSRIVFQTSKKIRKLKRHIRMKVKAYQSYQWADPDNPYVKEVTAYIDFFPFQNIDMSRVRYTVKRKKYRFIEKYGASSSKIKERKRKQQIKEDEWKRKRLEKDRKWIKNYYRKYPYVEK